MRNQELELGRAQANLITTTLGEQPPFLNILGTSWEGDFPGGTFKRDISPASLHHAPTTTDTVTLTGGVEIVTVWQRGTIREQSVTPRVRKKTLVKTLNQHAQTPPTPVAVR